MNTTRRARAGNNKTAVAYLRVSTDRQELGPEAQRAAIESWAAANGVLVVGWHVDQVSGAAAIDQRPGLLAALSAVKAEKAGVLVVAKRDRLARDVVVSAMVENAAAAAGARVVSADGVGNGDTAADGFMRTILDAAAAYERALIRARTKAALGAKKARGERAGAVPYGFVADENGKLSECEAEQSVIRIVLELRRAGLSLRAVVLELQKRGLVSRSGKAFQLTQVARMAS
jgi:DNA invertase Pin-like site-specific DNA recombinase